MPPITFYPGPSKVYPQVANYLQDAYNEGVLSINHRSAECVELVRNTVGLLQDKLNVPNDYSVFFVSSATESWEIISQSLVHNASFHLYNGAFGKKWLDYANRLHSLSTGHNFGLNTALDANLIPIPPDTEVLCLTQNETSNGTQVTPELVASFQSGRRHKGTYLTAVDATSSLGGVEFDFKTADIWYASVQKCLGLPAGLALLICSPRAVEKAFAINENNHYNSFLFLHENSLKFQTNYTPNVLNIYLLMRVLRQVQPIEKVGQRLREQAQEWYDFFESDASSFRPLAANPAVRSDTVITVSGEEKEISRIKAQAKQVGIILGNGYGQWKDTTFRIANFPTIEQKEIAALKHFIKANF